MTYGRKDKTTDGHSGTKKRRQDCTNTGKQKIFQDIENENCNWLKKPRILIFINPVHLPEKLLGEAAKKIKFIY